MSWSFNPFTGNLDLVGGGAVVFEGEVETFADLPETVGDPAVGASFLVRSSTGVWLVNRRQAGIWIRRNNTGVRATDWEYGGDYPVNSVNGQTGNVSLVSSDVAAEPIDYTVVTSATTLANGAKVAANTTAGAFTLTLPATPADGDTVSILDYAGTFDTNNLIIARNGSNIESLAEDMDCNIEDAAFSLVYVGSTVGWKVVPYFGNKTNFASPDPIGSSVANTGRFTTLSANNGTLTASAPVLDLSQTWNNAAVTFTGLRFNVTNTASATASVIADFQTNGTSRASIRQDGRINCSQVFTSDSVISGLNVQAATSSFFTWSGADMLIARDAADILAIRRSANPQTFRIYNTNDSSTAAGTNFERGFIGWSSNTLRIGTEAGGTGSNRNIEFVLGGATRLTLSTSGDLTWGSTGSITLPSAASFTFSGRGGIRATAQGSFRFLGSDGSTFNLLHFGVESASYPALKRVGTALQIRLGDDSADAPLSCGALTVSGNITHTGSLTLAATSTNNIIFNTNSTTRWQIGGSSGALVSSDGVPIRLGGSTSSFPQLKNSGAIVQVRLADDTGYTTIDANHRLQGTAPATSGATGTAGDIRYDADYIYVCTAANTWKRAAIATW